MDLREGNKNFRAETLICPEMPTFIRAFMLKLPYSSSSQHYNPIRDFISYCPVLYGFSEESLDTPSMFHC